MHFLCFGLSYLPMQIGKKKQLIFTFTVCINRMNYNQFYRFCTLIQSDRQVVLIIFFSIYPNLMLIAFFKKIIVKL